MPKKQFVLEDNGRHTLELTWGSFWKNFAVYYDGAPIAEIEGGGKALRTGKNIILPDGSDLNIKLKQSLIAAELEVLHNGQPLPGSPTHPLQRITQAYTVIFVIAFFNLLLGLAGVFFKSDFLNILGAGWGIVAFGLFLLILGWLVKAKQSLPALITAIVLYVADGLLGIVAAITSGGTPGAAGLIVRVFFIIAMSQGIGAIKRLNQSESSN